VKGENHPKYFPGIELSTLLAVQSAAKKYIYASWASSSTENDKQLALIVKITKRHAQKAMMLLFKHLNRKLISIHLAANNSNIERSAQKH
jgi:hypothetical protein